MSYGFQNSDAVTPGAQGGKFGLNSGAFITKFEFNPNGGKDGAPSECIDIWVKVGEREFRKRIYPVQKIFKDNVELTDVNSEDYKKEHAAAVKLLNADVSDFACALIPAATLEASLNVPINSFAQFAQIVERTVKGNNPNWNTAPVDVFLGYQWQPSQGQTRTWLELPKNLKHGKIVCAHIPGDFIEDKTNTHLRYATAEGVKHPFTRGEWYMGSDFSKATGDLSGSTEAAGNAMNQGAQPFDGGTTQNPVSNGGW